MTNDSDRTSSNHRPALTPVGLLPAALLGIDVRGLLAGAGAMDARLASPEVARGTKKKPVWVIGSGEAIQYKRNGADITVSSAAQSGAKNSRDLI